MDYKKLYKLRGHAKKLAFEKTDLSEKHFLLSIADDIKMGMNTPVEFSEDWFDNAMYNWVQYCDEKNLHPRFKNLTF